MSTFDTPPHTCSRCQEIVIDGTGPRVNWHREFSYHEVKHSQRCEFFSWALKFPTTHLYETDKLKLSICESSENFACVNVEWRDKDGKDVLGHDVPEQDLPGYDVPEHDTKRWLYIFSRKGKLSIRRGYAYG